MNFLTACLQQAGICLMASRQKNMKAQHPLADEWLIARHRRPIETVNSQLASMGINRLQVRTNNGFFLKIQAPLLTVWQTQMFRCLLSSNYGISIGGKNDQKQNF